MTSGGIALRFALGMVAGLVAVAVAFGFASAGHSAPERGGVLGAGQRTDGWATPIEIAWLSKLGAWDSRLLGGLQTSARAAGCSAGLAQIGRAPTARTARALVLFRQACSRFERAETSAGGALLREADQLLPPGEVRFLPVIAGQSAVSRIEPRFGEIASALAGKQVEVRCWSRRDWSRLLREELSYTGGSVGYSTLGFAGVDGSRANLAPQVCEGLVSLAYDHFRPVEAASQLMLAAAVVTLSHEPQHSMGVADEATAECNAIQLAAGTARKLGASPAYAGSLVRTYWSRYQQELPAYRSAECRAGGALDLRDPGTVWP